MDYTQSPDHEVHASERRMHQDSGPFPTVWTAKDANSVMWSLMAVLEAGGVAGQQFNAEVPASYDRLLVALRTLFEPPAGLVAHFALSAAPAGWLKANGSVVERSAYPRLFAAIGTMFGAGDGVTTFTLPDLRGEFMRGWDDGRGVDPGRALGSWQTGSPVPHDDNAAAAGINHVGLQIDSAARCDTWVPPFPEAYFSADGVPGDGSVAPASSAGFISMARPRNVALLVCIKT